MHVKTYNEEAQETGTIELPDHVFGLKWNGDLMHQVVVSYAANKRRGTAHVKDRGEVRGGGKKPWRQKGTGRARHGSIRSPIWVGGGVTHGPRKEKNYSKKIPTKMAKKALYMALSGKARDHEIVVMDDFSFPEGKTKRAAAIFEKLVRISDMSRIKKGKGALAVLPEKDGMTRRALKNLPYVGIDEARNLNAYEVMKYKYVLFSRKVIESFTN